MDLIVVPFGINTKQVSYQINGVSIGTVSSAPFAISIMPPARGMVRLQAIVEGIVGRVVDEVQFTVR